MNSFYQRRWFLGQCGIGLGAIASAELIRRGLKPASNAASSETSLNDVAKGIEHTSPILRSQKHPHFTPKIKNVIFIFMGGAPSQLELFDHKPELSRRDGELPPSSLLAGYRKGSIDLNSSLMGSRFAFARHGQCGAELSELLPHTAKVVDDLTIIKSMHSDSFNHAPAQILMNTGSTQTGKASLGAWTLYGLGSECDNLPGFAVLNSSRKGVSGGPAMWGSGFLPSRYQGVNLRSTGEPVMYVDNPKGVDRELQRDTFDTINRLNAQQLERTGDEDIATRIAAFEMAYRMQASAPELTDLNDEPQHILDAYNIETTAAGSFARNCLLARRMVQRGVRFVQLFHQVWDQHGKLTSDLSKNCLETDQACASLITDLKQRGMLDETLVIWGGEFGRTPMVQGTARDGRDHHPNAFTVWMAGGGLKSGMTLGKTDELGFNAVEDRVHVRDLHATILHLLGLDHRLLTYPALGLDQRLTGAKPARVVTEILA